MGKARKTKEEGAKTGIFFREGPIPRVREQQCPPIFARNPLLYRFRGSVTLSSKGRRALLIEYTTTLPQFCTSPDK